MTQEVHSRSSITALFDQIIHDFLLVSHSNYMYTELCHCFVLFPLRIITACTVVQAKATGLKYRKWQILTPQISKTVQPILTKFADNILYTRDSSDIHWSGVWSYQGVLKCNLRGVICTERSNISEQLIRTTSRAIWKACLVTFHDYLSTILDVAV